MDEDEDEDEEFGIDEWFGIDGVRMAVDHSGCTAEHSNCSLTLENGNVTDEDLPGLRDLTSRTPGLKFAHADTRLCTFSDDVFGFLCDVETRTLRIESCPHVCIDATRMVIFVDVDYEIMMDYLDPRDIPMVDIQEVPMSPEEFRDLLDMIASDTTVLDLDDIGMSAAHATAFAAFSFPVLRELNVGEETDVIDGQFLLELVPFLPRAPKLEILRTSVSGVPEVAIRAFADAVSHHLTPLCVESHLGDYHKALFDEAYQTAVAAKEVRVRSLVAGVAAVLALPSGNVRTDPLAVQVSPLQPAAWKVIEFLKPSGTM